VCTSIPRCQRHVVARDILLCPNTFKITQPDHSLVFVVYNSSVTLVPLVMVLKASDESHQDALSFSLEGNRAQCIKNGIDHRSSTSKTPRHHPDVASPEGKPSREEQTQSITATSNFNIVQNKPYSFFQLSGSVPFNSHLHILHTPQ